MEGIDYTISYERGCEILSVVSDSVVPWIIAHGALLSMEFSRWECWSGQPFFSPEDLPNPGLEPGSLALQADSLPSEPPGKPDKEYIFIADSQMRSFPSKNL